MVVAAATVLFAWGRSIATLIIARLLQGFASAIVFTVGYALLFDKFGHEQIGMAMGYTNISLSLGVLSAPVIGGTLYQHGGYIEVFIPALTLIFIDIVLRCLLIDEEGDLATATESLPSTVDTGVPNNVASNRYASLRQAVEVDPLLDNFNLSQGVSRSPTLTLLSSPRFLVSIISLCTLQSFATGFDAVLPVFAHERLGYDAQLIAYLFLALSIPVLLSPLSGMLSDRVGPKWPACAGLVMIIPSLIWVGQVDQSVEPSDLKLFAFLFCVGCALTITTPPLMADVASSVEEIEQKSLGIFGPSGAYGQAFGLMNTASGGGSMLGPLYLGLLRQILGWPAMALCLASLSSITLVCVMLMTGGCIWD